MKFRNYFFLCKYEISYWKEYQLNCFSNHKNMNDVLPREIILSWTCLMEKAKKYVGVKCTWSIPRMVNNFSMSHLHVRDLLWGHKIWQLCYNFWERICMLSQNFYVFQFFWTFGMNGTKSKSPLSWYISLTSERNFLEVLFQSTFFYSQSHVLIFFQILLLNTIKGFKVYVWKLK